ncbi:MAG: pilin [Patescibacteria group bacterium]
MFSFFKRGGWIALFCLAIFGSVVPVHVYAQATEGTTPRGETIPGDGCVDVAINAAGDAAAKTAKRQAIETLARQLNTQPVDWHCSRACTTQLKARCVSGGCPTADADGLCCAPGTGPVPVRANQCSAATGSTTARASTGGIGSISLPACVTSHDADVAGKCTLSDIINTGISVANFLFGLGAALFFGIFILGGAYYIFFAYDSGSAKKGKEMIKNATIGMLIMILAGTMVRFAKDSITGGTVSIGTDTGETAPDNAPSTAPAPGTTPAPGAPGATAQSNCHCTVTLVPDLAARTVGGFAGTCASTNKCQQCDQTRPTCAADFPATAQECADAPRNPWSIGTRIGLTEAQVSQAREHVELQNLQCTITPSR